MALLDDRVGIDRGAEVEAAGGDAADHPRLGGQRHVTEDLFLVGDGGDPLRHADAEVDDAPGGKLEGAAAGDDLAFVERHRRQRVERHPDLGRERRIVLHGVGLGVVLRPGDDDAIDENSRHLHLPGMERAGLGDTLHLGDDETARVARRHRHHQVVEGQRLLLHGDVAGGIGGGAADERDVDRKRLVEQPLLAAEGDQLDQVLGGDLVDLAAFEAGIDEGSHADLGDGSGPAGGDVAVEMGDHPLRQVVGLDLVGERQPADLGDQPPVAADRPLQQTVMAEPVETPLATVALAGGEHQGQAAGRPGLHESPLQGQQQLLRRAVADETGVGEGIAVADNGDRLVRRDDLVLHRTSTLTDYTPAAAAT